MNDLEKQKKLVELSKEKDEQENSGHYIKGLIICLVINFVIAGLVILFGSTSNDQLELSEWLVLLSDAFTIPGGFMMLFYLITWVSGEGAFDAIVYGVQLAFYTVFYKDLRETKLPKTYADYRALKSRKKKTNLTFMLLAGAIFFVIGIGFIIAFNINVTR